MYAKGMTTRINNIEVRKDFIYEGFFEAVRLADTWKKNWMRKSKLYQDFMDYLNKEKGLPLRVEMTYVDYEPGAMLIEYVREGKCNLPVE